MNTFYFKKKWIRFLPVKLFSDKKIPFSEVQFPKVVGSDPAKISKFMVNR
jgi:hypothetical protein